MTKFIELTSLDNDGKPLLINVAHIIDVEPAEHEEVVEDAFEGEKHINIPATNVTTTQFRRLQGGYKSGSSGGGSMMTLVRESYEVVKEKIKKVADVK